jgi:hypothetical protein
MNENSAIELRDNAKAQLMEIKTIETGIEYLNKVKAIEVWIKAEKKDAELQNLIAEQKIRTQRKIGELLQKNEVNKNVGNRYLDGKGIQPSNTLSHYEITKNESSVFQKIASLPEDIFEQQLTEAKQDELTTSRILNVAKIHEQQHKKENAQLTKHDNFLIEKLKQQETVIINMKTDLAAMHWAEQNNKFIRADRNTQWGNPFIFPDDGTRNEVCDNYEKHYLPHKPSLLNNLYQLEGKALGCWCAPLRCHCDSLIKALNDVRCK